MGHNKNRKRYSVCFDYDNDSADATHDQSAATQTQLPALQNTPNTQGHKEDTVAALLSKLAPDLAALNVAIAEMRSGNHDCTDGVVPAAQQQAVAGGSVKDPPISLMS